MISKVSRSGLTAYCVEQPLDLGRQPRITDRAAGKVDLQRQLGTLGRDLQGPLDHPQVDVVNRVQSFRGVQHLRRRLRATGLVQHPQQQLVPGDAVALQLDDRLRVQREPVGAQRVGDLGAVGALPIAARHRLRHQRERAVGRAGGAPGVFGVDQQLVAARAAVGVQPDQAAPGPGPGPRFGQHEGLRAQRLHEQLRLLAGHRPGSAGQQHADLAGPDPAEQHGAADQSLRHPRGGVQEVGPVTALGRFHPDDEHGTAGPPQGPVDLVGEPGAGEQAGRRVTVDHRGLDGVHPAGEAGDLTPRPFADRHVAHVAADAADCAVRAGDRLEAAVHVEPAAVAAHHPDGGVDRLATGPRAGDCAEGAGMVVVMDVPGEHLTAELVLDRLPPEQFAEPVRPHDPVTARGVREPRRFFLRTVVDGRSGLRQDGRWDRRWKDAGGGAAGGTFARYARTQKAFVGCRHRASPPPARC